MATANSTRITRSRTSSKGAKPASDLIQAAGALCSNLQPFFELAEKEIKEKNNTDFDRIEFLVKAARSEIHRFSSLICDIEERTEGGAE